MSDPKVTATLTIEMLDNGIVNVTGPLGNKSLCYGLIECARDSVKDYHDKHARDTKPGAAEMPRFKLE